MKYMISVLCVVAAVLSALTVQKLRRQIWDDDCKRNLRNIATALEMYSTDYGGRFPPTLVDTTPNYLRTVPTCPSTKTVAYDYKSQS